MSRDLDVQVKHLAAAVRRSRAAARSQGHANARQCTTFRGQTDLADEILSALESGSELPSRRAFRGPSFEPIEPKEAFSSTVERTDVLNFDGLPDHITDALLNCEEADPDEAHWEGPDGELLEHVASCGGQGRVQVVRVLDPFNPVGLFTPLSEEPLAAVAAVDIATGEPIAPYLGDVVTEDDPSIDETTNTYLFELDPDELALRGYDGPRGVGLRVDASKRGGLARFVNDRASFGLPARTANSYLELLYDGEQREWVVMLFASERIPKGREIIVDYGPDYWQVALPSILNGHEASSSSSRPRAGVKNTKPQPKGAKKNSRPSASSPTPRGKASSSGAAAATSHKKILGKRGR